MYSGVVADTNGNSDDPTNVATTYHRGLSPTDSDGFVSFTTKFPGLYSGRTTHIHIMTHTEGTVNNATYSGGRISHVGQLFSDQSLITEVQNTGVYAANTNPVTLNADDRSLVRSAAVTFDPVVQYVLLGDSVEDGLLAWISVGINMTNDVSVSPAGTLNGGGAAPSGTAGNDGARIVPYFFALLVVMTTAFLL